MPNIITLSHRKKGQQTLKINNEKFEPLLDNTFDIPQALVGKININEFPEHAVIMPYESDDIGECHFKKMPIRLENIGQGKVSIDIEACKEKLNPDDNIGIQSFQNINSLFVEIF